MGVKKNRTICLHYPEKGKKKSRYYGNQYTFIPIKLSLLHFEVVKVKHIYAFIIHATVLAVLSLQFYAYSSFPFLTDRRAGGES